MFEATEPRAMGATCGGVRVWSVYVPNGRELGHPHYEYKLHWLDALRATVAEDELTDRFAVLGDFNIAPTDADVWDATAVARRHARQRAGARGAGRAARARACTDVVPRALKYDTPYTYWDYRAGMFHKNMGMRIDLVLRQRGAGRRGRPTPTSTATRARARCRPTTRRSSSTSAT